MPDKIACEPVEQFGMRRTLTHDAEVRRRADEAATEMVQPDAVDQHPRDERVCAAGEPARKGEPATAGREFRIFLRQPDRLAGKREHTQPAGLDRFLWLFRIAAMKQVRDRRLVGRLGQGGDEVLRRFSPANLGDLRVHRL